MKTTINRKKNKRIQGFQMVQEECIWMKAGVVTLHMCNNAYDCFDCKFDKAMTKAMAKKAHTPQKGAGWASHYKKKYNGEYRPCRHAITGRINEVKICTHSYDCRNCSFDQMLDDIEISQIQSRPELLTVSGFDFAKDYQYHDGHTWVRMEHGGMARIGFDAFVMKLFGNAKITHETLGIGSQLESGKPGWAIEQDHHNANVLSPISGTILSINERIRHNPELMHIDPYHDGWLFIIEPKTPLKDLNHLKTGNSGITWLENEQKKLLTLSGPEYANLAATGGEPVHDFYGLNPDISWETLVQTFLKTV